METNSQAFLKKNLSLHGGTRIRQKAKKKRTKSQLNTEAETKFWGCFSCNGLSPILLISEAMTKEVHKSVLGEEMLTFASEKMPPCWDFHQDNDPKHCTRAASSWFARNNIRLLQWPRQLPDLKPIENI